jgi:tetratricopeptide (TPR) repeat protein
LHSCQAHYCSEEYKEALADYDQVLSLDPSYVSAHNGRALIHYMRGTLFLSSAPLSSLAGDWAEALKGFMFCTEQNMDNAVFWHNKGSVHFQLGQYAEALRDLNRALELQPNDQNALVSRGTTHFNLGARDVCHFEALSVGTCSLNEAHFQAALEDYNRAVLLDTGAWGPTSIIALNSRGRTLLELERYQEVYRCSLEQELTTGSGVAGFSASA